MSNYFYYTIMLKDDSIYHTEGFDLSDAIDNVLAEEYSSVYNVQMKHEFVKSIKRVRAKKILLIYKGQKMKKIRTENNTVVYKIEKSNECSTCQDAYKLLNCDTIEVVNLNNGDCFIVDERGKLKDPPLPINPLATLIWSKSFSCDNYGYQFFDQIVGDVILIEKKLRKDLW